MATAKATTTGRKDESPLRFSGAGSLLEGCGSVMRRWMLEPQLAVARRQLADVRSFKDLQPGELRMGISQL